MDEWQITSWLNGGRTILKWCAVRLSTERQGKNNQEARDISCAFHLGFEKNGLWHKNRFWEDCRTAAYWQESLHFFERTFKQTDKAFLSLAAKEKLPPCGALKMEQWNYDGNSLDRISSRPAVRLPADNCAVELSPEISRYLTCYSWFVILDKIISQSHGIVAKYCTWRGTRISCMGKWVTLRRTYPVLWFEES